MFVFFSAEIFSALLLLGKFFPMLVFAFHCLCLVFQNMHSLLVCIILEPIAYIVIEFQFYYFLANGFSALLLSNRLSF